MARLKTTFTNGIMDKDTDKSLLKTFRHAENLRFHINGGYDGTARNIKGTTKIADFTDGNEDLKCITGYFNADKDVIYFMLASTDGVISKICEYDIVNNTSVIIAEDNQSILNLQKSGYITGINEINGLLLWSEFGNNPRRLNIERARGYGLNGFTEEDITLIVIPPLQKPKLTLQYNNSIIENNIEEYMFSFSYRWRYLDGEYSVLAPFTEFAFHPKNFNYNYAEQSNTSMVNKFNQILIEFNTGNERVTEIQLVFKETTSKEVWIIDDFDKELLGYDNNIKKTFIFSNNKQYRALSQYVVRSFFDNIPLTNKAQTLLDGRLILSNYTENYDIKTNEGIDIKIDYYLELKAIENTIPKQIYGETVDYPSLIAKKTIKSNRSYEVLIVYGDWAGRITTPLKSITNTLNVPSSYSVTENSIDVVLKNKPPGWAKFYRFFIKQSTKNYDQIIPTQFYQDGSYRWIKLEGADKDKIKEGDYLIVKSDSQGILNTLVKTKVLELSVKEKNFLQPDDIDDSIKEISGLYFKILPESFRINEDDYETFEINTYHNARRKYHNCLTNSSSNVGVAHFYGDTLNDLTSGGTYTEGGTENKDKRFLIKIDNLQTAAKGKVTLNSGSSGSIDGITVNGIQIMSGSVPFNIDLATTAIDVAANITTYTSTPNYTATSVGSEIIITSVILGNAVNGFAVVSSLTTLTSTNTNMLSGTENTFKWSVDDGASWESENVGITAGISQHLSNGVTITFTNNIGHSLLDEWNIYVRSTLKSSDQHAYGFFRILGDKYDTMTSKEHTLDDEIIESGARITIEFDEYNTGSVYFELNEISSNKYDNIQEWYYKENIGSKILAEVPDFPLENIFFMRGILKNDNDGNAQYLEYSDDGYMTMVIQSKNTQTGSKWVKLRAKTTLFQSDGDARLIFETEAKEESDIFYEIGKTYNIENNYHISDSDIATDVDQSSNSDLRVKLDWFNAFSYGNAVESYKIKDEFNKKGLDLGIRTLVPIAEEYKQVTRIADLTWSDVYNDDSDFNGLNSFNLSLVNFLSLDKENGSVQKLHNSNGNLMILQEDAVGLMPYNKNIIYDTEGGNFVGVSQNILTKESYRPYAFGQFGISKSPESFISVGNRNFFIDPQRGAFIQLSNNGVTELQEQTIDYSFSEMMINNKNEFMIGGYDPKHKEYLLSLPASNNTLVYKLKAKGFPNIFTFNPEFMLNANNEFYAWKNGIMYKMNDSETRNNFFDVQYPSKIKFYVNELFGKVKLFNAMKIHSTHAWDISLDTEITSREIPKESFEKIENHWYSEIMGNTNSNIDANSIFGLGSYEIIDGEINVLIVPVTISVGDFISSNTIGFTKNKIVDIQDKKIILEDKMTQSKSFLMYSKNQNVDGGAIRGDVMEVEMTIDTVEDVILKAVDVEVEESEIS